MLTNAKNSFFTPHEILHLIWFHSDLFHKYFIWALVNKEIRAKTLKYYIDTKEEHACVNSFHFHEDEETSIPIACDCIQPDISQKDYAFKHWQEEVKKNVSFYLPESALPLLSYMFHVNNGNNPPKIAHGTMDYSNKSCPGPPSDYFAIGYEMDRLMFFFYERENVHYILVQLNDREKWNGKDWVYIVFDTHKENSDVIQYINLYDYTGHSCYPTIAGFSVRHGWDQIRETHPNYHQIVTHSTSKNLPVIGLELYNEISLSHGKPTRGWDTMGKDIAILINRAGMTFLRHIDHACKRYSYMEYIRKLTYNLCNITETEDNKNPKLVFY